MSNPDNLPGNSVVISDISSVYYPVTNYAIMSFNVVSVLPGYTWTITNFWLGTSTNYLGALNFQDLITGDTIPSFTLTDGATIQFSYKYPYVDYNTISTGELQNIIQPPYSGKFFYYLSPQYINNTTSVTGNLENTNDWRNGASIINKNNTLFVNVPYTNDITKPFTSGLPPNIQVYNLIGTYDATTNLFTISGLLVSNPNQNCIILMTIFNDSYNGMHIFGGQYPITGQPLIIKSGEVFNYSFKFSINGNPPPYPYPNYFLPEYPNSGDTYAFSFAVQLNMQSFYAVRPWIGSFSFSDNTNWLYPGVSGVYVRIP